MAQLPQDLSLLSGLNTNVAFNNPVQTAQMQVQALAPLNQIGETLTKQGMQIYSHNQQQAAIQQAYQDAAAGKFSTVAGITGPNQEYNKIMDNLAPAIMASKAGTQLDDLYNKIQLDPNFNPATASQQYAQSAKGIIDAYTQESVPERWKSAVSLTIQKQAIQHGIQMNNTVLQRILSVQTAESLQAIDALKSQITQAASLGNDGLANELLAQRNNAIKQGVNAGVITPLQANSWQKEGADEIKLQTALRTGQAITDDAALETKRLSIYSQQQKAIEVSQLQAGFLYEEYLTRLMHGENPQSPVQGFSNQQEAYNARAKYLYSQKQTDAANARNSSIQQHEELAKITGQYFNLFKTLSLNDRLNIKTNNLDLLPEQYREQASLFKQLPAQYQNTILQNLKEYDNLINTAPVEALGLPSLDFSQTNSVDINHRAANIIANGSKIENIATADELKHLVRISSQNMALADNLIASNYGRYAPIVRDKLAKMQPIEALGYTVSNTSVIPKPLRDAYVNKPASTNLLKNNWVNKNLNKAFGNNYFAALQNLTPQEQINMVAYINGVMAGSGGAIEAYDAFDKSFDVYQDKIIGKGDKDYLASAIFKRAVKEKGITDTGSFIYFPSTDTYRAVDKDGLLIADAIYTGKALRALPIDYSFISKANSILDKKASQLKAQLINAGNLLNE